MAMQTLNLPPFPPLQWNEGGWAGNVILPSWAGCPYYLTDEAKSKVGPDSDPVSSNVKSDGSARLLVAPEDEDARSPPLPEQVRAFQWLLDNEAAIAASILRSLFAAYPGWRNSYERNDAEWAAEVIPEIDKAEQLRTLIALSNVFILSVARDGIAYIGFHFGCTWEEEHCGFGVMTHRDRVVEIGDADTSMLAPAEADAELEE